MSEFADLNADYERVAATLEGGVAEGDDEAIVAMESLERIHDLAWRYLEVSQ